MRQRSRFRRGLSLDSTVLAHLPFMLKRSTITEQFSTFIELADNRFSRWIPDARLSRSMAAALAHFHEQGEHTVEDLSQVWTAYWYKLWCDTRDQNNPSAIPYGHLTAFVQEACYWAAHETARFSSTQYDLVDYFQHAIARFDFVLKHFSPEKGSRLDTYAHSAFRNILRDTLRQQKEIDICSNWGLLLRLSQKRLEESLRAAGQREVGPYVLAWRCFKVAYASSTLTTRQLEQPNAEIWQVITDAFNQQRQTMTPIPPGSDAATLSLWLCRCADVARAYLYPKATSLNVPSPGRDSGELQDTLATPEENSLLDAMVAAEEVAARRSQQVELDKVLREALLQLPAEAQSILALYYRQGQTQQQIAKALDLKQYTVSRRLSKARAALLNKVSLWSRDTLHISLTSDILTIINTVLEEWLHSYYSAAAQPQETLQ